MSTPFFNLLEALKLRYQHDEHCKFMNCVSSTSFLRSSNGAEIVSIPDTGSHVIDLVFSTRSFSAGVLDNREPTFIFHQYLSISIILRLQDAVLQVWRANHLKLFLAKYVGFSNISNSIDAAP